MSFSGYNQLVTLFLTWTSALWLVASLPQRRWAPDVVTLSSIMDSLEQWPVAVALLVRLTRQVRCLGQ